MSEHFEVGRNSIDPGITLIEASAGTGKTFAIAGMVVRLVAEKGYSLDRILVVTFTEAATQELRDRVRSRIREAVILLEEGRPTEDPALATFVEAAEERKTAAIRSLKNALLGFDEAAIFTIHGFCQRMLRENAFETGALFDVELSTDAESVWRETAEDFWRKCFYTASPDVGSLVVWLQARGRLSPEVLVDLLRKISRHPELEILTEKETFSFEQCRDRVTDLTEELRGLWRSDRDTIGAVLLETKALSVNQKDGYPTAVIETILRELEELAGDGPLSPTVWGALMGLSARRLEEKTKKNKVTPAHPFFEKCAELEELIEAFVRLARIRFMDLSRDGLAEAKKRRNVITFDDLLTRLYEGLRGSGGDGLARAIGRRFSAALIDEFQDTDPVQWEIFYRVFGVGEHVLYLIGDPKQAIYGFRGADIFTYLKAREKANGRFTLGTNWRSDRELVEGANQLFSRHDETFVFPEIAFFPVDPSDGKAGSELDLGTSGLAPEPLQLACVTGDDGEALAVGPAKERILDQMLNEIRLLLGGEVKRNAESLEPGDIAILVRTNREAERVRERLVETGIPAVVRTDRSVLQTEEAEHLLRLLTAILEPHKNGLVKSCLASPLFGYGASEIHEVDQNESEWQELTERFHGWQEAWGRHGFMRMFRSFMAGEGVSARLLRLRDGERMVTNYQHIAECLHAAEYERMLTPNTLTRWLREQSERSEGDGDSYVIRLEKDEKAVQIVTIHRSKGLEYPVVFCPFNWTNVVGRNNGRDILFHDRNNGDRLTWDLRPEPDPANVEAFRREQLAEAIRLLYVGVTRARNRCYLFWAVTRDSAKADNCALAQAFGCGAAGGPDTALAAFETLGGNAAAALHRPIALTGPTEWRIPRPAGERLAARIFEGSFSSAPLITSFSGLVSRAHEEAPDRDALPELAPAGAGAVKEGEESPGPSIFNFPKGAKAGNFFHGLLEEIDFTQPDEFGEKVARYLGFYRFDPAYAPVVGATLRDLMNLQLPGQLKLGEIGWSDRLVEAPFYFPVKRMSPGKLAEMFGASQVPENFRRGLGRLDFDPVHGYMTGFIDLVVRHGGRYFLVDWKSNWLGADRSAYDGKALREAMSGNFYYLQYHLYTLALDRHLSCTLADYDYERHFGGVYYLFLRGIDTGEGQTGVFYDRPSLETVRAMRENLLEETELRTEATR